MPVGIKSFLLSKNQFFFYRNVSKKFPDFPDEDEGGSNKIFENKTVAEIQAELDAVRFRFFIIYELNFVFRKWKVKAKKAKAIKKVNNLEILFIFIRYYF